MISYIKKRVFAKIGLVFFVASLCIVYSSYYLSVYWTNLEKDNILDAQEAYLQYKLIESWGSPPDTALIAQELNNIKIKGMIYSLDGDTLCSNDTLLHWTNLQSPISPCNYLSYNDTEYLGEVYDISFEERVSFGEFFFENQYFQTAYIEYPPYKYFLITDYVAPLDLYTLLPSLVLAFALMSLLFFIVRRFLFPLNLIERRIKSLEKGDLESTIPVVGSDELAVLTKNFNRLTSDIKQLLRQKERLLSDVSHELRTPLAKIKLAIALMPEHKKKESIDRQIKTLDSLITNILLSDKMASAYSNLKIEQIELSLLIKKALELTSIKNVDLQLQKNTLLHVDIVKSSIAIKNLIENAFKYSPKNSLIVVEGKTLNNEIVISVVDQGAGIPEEQLEKITKAFVRIPGSKESGFGLGLSICNKVMEAHAGSLKIQNSAGGGACFSLHFPIKK